MTILRCLLFLFVFFYLTAAAQVPDSDGDGVGDDVDNCIDVANPDQADTDDDGFGNPCDPDLNNDLTTNFGDLSLFAEAFLTDPTMPNWNPHADFNGDGRINFGDLPLMAALFLRSPGPSGDYCPPSVPGVVRGQSAYVNPPPRVTLRQAMAEYQRADPDAVFGIFNCEVDYFATTPKDTVPDYARDILAGLGLSAEPVEIVRMLEPTAAEKPAQDLDSPENRIFQFPLLFEPEDPQPPPDGEDLDLVENDPSPTTPPEIVRTRPPVFLEPPPDPYVPPGEDAQGRNEPAAMPILAAFLEDAGEIFKLPRDPSGGADLSSLAGMRYSEGRFFRKMEFDGQMLGDTPLLDGRTIVMTDNNWNVIAISRQLVTPGKLAIPEVTPIPENTGAEIAARIAADFYEVAVEDVTVASYELNADAVRKMLVAKAKVVGTESSEIEATVLLNAATGDLLNISDDVLAYTDAKLKRWAYSGGNLVSGAYQVTSTGIYTRDDNTLQHDFFYMQTDNRGGGTFPSPFTCTATPRDTPSFLFAYNTTTGFQFIRHTHRTARDFNLWSPAASSGSFHEGHAYFWARKFALWQRPTLSHLGVLSSNVSNYKRFNMIVNACTDDWYATKTLPVTTQHNEGETLYKIRLREDCKSTNTDCSASDYDDDGGDFVTCQGNGCGTTPAVIQHEMVHFTLSQYFGVGSSLDCGSGNEQKLLHEGTMGSILPQAFWQYYYGVGYNPPDSHLFTKDQPRGRVHANNATNLKLTSWLCSNNTSGQGPYDAGRVASQPMWEFYHGKRADGNSLVNILRPSNDLTFLNLAYWAVDLVGASTWKDRYEVANRWMQLSINNLSFSSNAQKEQLRSQWCATWEHHELENFINNAYCP